MTTFQRYVIPRDEVSLHLRFGYFVEKVDVGPYVCVVVIQYFRRKQKNADCQCTLWLCNYNNTCSDQRLEAASTCGPAVSAPIRRGASLPRSPSTAKYPEMLSSPSRSVPTRPRLQAVGSLVVRSSFFSTASLRTYQAGSSRVAAFSLSRAWLSHLAPSSRCVSMFSMDWRASFFSSGAPSLLPLIQSGKNPVDSPTP